MSDHTIDLAHVQKVADNSFLYIDENGKSALALKPALCAELFKTDIQIYQIVIGLLANPNRKESDCQETLVHISRVTEVLEAVLENLETEKE